MTMIPLLSPITSTARFRQLMQEIDVQVDAMKLAGTPDIPACMVRKLNEVATLCRQDQAELSLLEISRELHELWHSSHELMKAATSSPDLESGSWLGILWELERDGPYEVMGKLGDIWERAFPTDFDLVISEIQNTIDHMNAELMQLLGAGWSQRRMYRIIPSMMLELDHHSQELGMDDHEEVDPATQRENNIILCTRWADQIAQRMITCPEDNAELRQQDLMAIQQLLSAQ